MRIKVKEYYEKLTKGVENLLQGQLGNFLKFQAKFRKYSFSNVLMIYLQNPNATRVAGVRTWNSLGRRIRKGEKGIAIFAPMIKKVEDQDKTADIEISEEDINKPEKSERLFGFRAVYVFDVSQTEGDPLPELPEHGVTTVMNGNPTELFKHFLSVSPVPVSYKSKDDMGRCLGYYSRKENNIVLAEGLSAVDNATTLLHELAHYFAIQSEEHSTSHSDRPKAEVIAEGAAYIASCHLGLDSSGNSFSYVAQWGQDIQKILAWGNAVQNTAGKLIDLVETNTEIEKAA
jgi:antirestriction protein ArdC